MNTNELRKWAEKHDIEKKTIDGFWQYINSYEKEEDEPFFHSDVDKSQLVINLNGVGLFIDAWNKDSYFQYGFDFIISYLPVIYQEEELGTYKLYFTLDGEIFDDRFSPY
jgi:hypothetical protein